jgi:hypothetical protein
MVRVKVTPTADERAMAESLVRTTDPTRLAQAVAQALADHAAQAVAAERERCAVLAENLCGEIGGDEYYIPNGVADAIREAPTCVLDAEGGQLAP